MNRRQLLARSTGAVILGSLAGCLGEDVEPSAGETATDDTGSTSDGTATTADDNETEPDGTDTDTSAGPQGIEAWPMFQFDAENTGHAPDAVGPTESIEASWRFETSAAVSSPPVVTTGAVFVGTENGEVYYVDPDTGQQRRRFDVRGSTAVGLFDDRLCISSGPRPSDSSRGSGAYYYDVTVFDPETGNQAFQRDLPAHDVAPAAGPPTITSDGVYLTTGETRSYYGYTTSYRITLNDPDEERRAFMWEHETGGQLSGGQQVAPAVVDGSVYLPTGSVMRAVERNDADGEQAWNFPADAAIKTAPSVSGDRLFFGTDGGSVYALDTANGLQAWRADLGDTVRSSPAIADGTVYVGCDDGVLYALDAASGEAQWTVEAESDGTPSGVEIRAAPVVANGTVHVGTTAGRCHAVDAASGERLWSHETSGAVRHSPAVVGNTVYVGDDDGILYALST